MSLLSRCSLLFLGLPILASSPIFADSIPGVANFYQVDKNVYRGAQPTAQGFQQLASMGVKTVLDLREADGRSVEEKRQVTAAGMQYVNVPMTGLTPPSEEEIANILVLLENSVAGPVFVHCKRGADRTGAVIAAYRISHDHWNNRQALSEAMSRKMSFFQLPRQDFIKRFQARSIQANAHGDPTFQAPVEMTALNAHTTVLQPATAEIGQ